MSIQKIHLSLKASNLMNVAGGRRRVSDPYATVSLSLSANQSADRMMLGKTEVYVSCIISHVHVSNCTNEAH